MSDTPLTREQVHDAFKNLMSGMRSTRDRSTHGEWEAYAYDRTTLESAYATDWVAKQIVCVPADEVNRRWRHVTTPSMSSEEIKAFESAERDAGVKQMCVRAIKWARCFGGGGITITTDEQELAEPFDPSHVRRGAAFSLAAFDRDEVVPSVTNLRGMTPTAYLVATTGALVDASRVLRFDGFDLPRDTRRNNSYWGGSILLAALPAVERCSTVSAALAQLVEEANIDVISVPELFQKLASVQTASDVRARFAEGDLVKSLYRVMLLDKNEEYTRHELSSSLTGLTQLLMAFYQLPAAASGVPVTKLLGISPGGLNATGESDLENYYDLIDTLREGDVANALNIIDPLICQSLFGKTFPDWTYEWESLWQEDKKEKAETQERRSNIIYRAYELGLIPASATARQLLDEGIITAIDGEYIEALEGVENLDDDALDGTASRTVGVVPPESGGDVQKQALNGAQMAELANYIRSVNAGEMTRAQALGAARLAFPDASADELERAFGTEQDVARLIAARAARIEAENHDSQPQ